MLVVFVEFVTGQLVRLDPAALRSNTFAIEWPPRSGAEREFPEVEVRASRGDTALEMARPMSSAPPMPHAPHMKVTIRVMSQAKAARTIANCASAICRTFW